MNGLYAIHFNRQSPPVRLPRNISVGVRRATRGLSPARYPDPSLAGLWDDLKQVVAPYVASAGAKVKSEFSSQLDAAQTKLENQIGLFLTTGQTLTDVLNRAQAQTNSSNAAVKSRAQAVAAKTNALLNNYASIKTDALKDVQNLVTLKNQLETSEVFKVADPTSMGTRILELFNQYKSQLGQVLSASVSVGSRIEAHIQQTNEVKSDVESLESYAQGKGWSATVDSLGGLASSNISTVVKIAAVGGLIYLLAPSFIGRLGRSRS